MAVRQEVEREAAETQTHQNWKGCSSAGGLESESRNEQHESIGPS